MPLIFVRTRSWTFEFQIFKLLLTTCFELVNIGIEKYSLLVLNQFFFTLHHQEFNHIISKSKIYIIVLLWLNPIPKPYNKIYFYTKFANTKSLTNSHIEMWQKKKNYNFMKNYNELQKNQSRPCFLKHSETHKRM